MQIQFVIHVRSDMNLVQSMNMKEEIEAKLACGLAMAEAL